MGRATANPTSLGSNIRKMTHGPANPTSMRKFAIQLGYELEFRTTRDIKGAGRTAGPSCLVR